MKTDVLNKIWNYFDVHMQEVLRGTSIAFLLKLVAVGLGFSLNVVIARSLGASGAGLYFLSLILVSIVATLGQVGTASTLVRFVSAGYAENNWGKIKGVYRQSLLLSFSASLMFSIALFFLAPVISHSLFDKPDLTIVLQIMSVAILPFTMYSIHASALQGLKKIRDSNIVLGVSAPAFTLLGCAILISENSVLGVAFAYALSAVLTMLIGILFWRAYTANIAEIQSKFEFSLLLKSALPLFGVDIFNLLQMWSATIFLGMWGTESELGIFQISTRIAMLTSFILVAVNSIFTPKLSECFACGDRQLAGSLIKKTTGLMLLLATPVLLLIVLFPHQILMVFGEEFQDGANLLIILSVAQFVNVATGPVTQALIMSGNEKKLRQVSLVAAIVSVFSGFFLVYNFGSVGAAYSVFIGVVTANLLAAYCVYRFTGIKFFG